jgi:[histone H3]-dimethyl-L-lysine9 demethylase
MRSSGTAFGYVTNKVCNLTSCIKVACDFVSPHCIKKCCELMQWNRKLAQVRGGQKEDVLQLKAMLISAWEEMARWTGTKDSKEDHAT